MDAAAEVNSLTSSDTELPYNYYSLPFCQPVEGVKKSASASINPGTILAGSNVQNSPYNFSILVLPGCASGVQHAAAVRLNYKAEAKTKAVQVEERAKTVCKPENYHAALTERQARVSVQLHRLAVMSMALRQPAVARRTSRRRYRSGTGCA